MNVRESQPPQSDFKGIFERYYSRLVHFSYQIIADKSASEDIVQDIFIKYWNQYHDVSSEEAVVKSFLYTSVRNASLNALRHNKVEEQYISSQNPFPADEAVIQSMIRSEVLAELYGAIASLPASCREISLRGYIQGMKNHEIATELGISINTVKTQKQRALKLLRLRLSPELLALLLTGAQLL